MMNLYSIYDVCMEEFAPPFVAKNDKTASRMFLQGLKKLPSPEDLTLWRIGYFYPESKEEPCVIGEKAEQVPIDMNGGDDVE